MKNLVAALLTLILLLAAASSTAMAASDNGPSSTQFMKLKPPSHAKSPAPQRGEKIYFYSFDGTYLRTSAGTFHMPSAKLVNHTGEDLLKIDGSRKRMEVKLTVLERRVTQADVYPDSGQ